jgi:hypothetical protein
LFTKAIVQLVNSFQPRRQNHSYWRETKIYGTI